MIKIWVDSNRPAPDGYMCADNSEDAISLVKIAVNSGIEIEVLDIDNGIHEFAMFGKPYNNVLEWMADHKIKNVPIHIHSDNPLTILNIQVLISLNDWIEI